MRWYLQFPISYRDLERMLADRGVAVDHTTIFRWIQNYAPELDKRLRPHLRTTTGSWRVDETYVKVKGRWMYLYRAVDVRGQTIDFLLSAKRDAAAARGSVAKSRAFSIQLRSYPAAEKKFTHSAGLIASMPCRMASQRASFVRAAAFFRKALSLENAISIGLKSGL